MFKAISDKWTKELSASLGFVKMWMSRKNSFRERVLGNVLSSASKSRVDEKLILNYRMN